MQLPLIANMKKLPAPWMLGLAAAGLVGISATTFVIARQAAPKGNSSELTVPAQTKDVTVQITASGSVVPVQTVNLSPKTAGRLVKLMVEQGDRVTQGQLIARMEGTELKSDRDLALANLAQAEASLSLVQAGNRSEAIGQAKASVDQTRADVAAAQTRLDLASERVRRNQSLFAQGAVSRDRLDEVLNEERSARANLEQTKARVNNSTQQLAQQENGPRIQEIEQAVAQVAAARAKLQAVDTQIENTLIRAPFAGIITQKYATEGAFVTPMTSASSTSSATSTSIAALANGLEIVAKVPEVDIGQIKLGQVVDIKADAYPDQVFKGEVRLIAPEAIVEQNVTSFQVRIKVVTGKQELRSGMNTDLTFLGQSLPQALMVPTVAIVTNKGQTGVLVPGTNNKPRFKSVTIGSTIGNQTQILDGIKAGDPVFVELPEGQKLEDITKGIDEKK